MPTNAKPREEDEPVARSVWFSPIAMAIVIVLAIWAANCNSLNGPFVFDDRYSILENPTIRRLWPPGEALSPPGQGNTVQGRPLVNLTLAINYALGGTGVRGYHIFNLCLHTLNALLLFGIIRRTLLLPRFDKTLHGASAALAFWIALLWGVHPLTTAAVAYVVQRAESLAAFFYLLTIFCLMRADGAKRPGFWECAGVLSCWCGMASKETAVGAPLMALLYDRVFLTGSWKEIFGKRNFFYIGLAASWLLLAYLATGGAGRGGTAGFSSKVAWQEYSMTQAAAIPKYLRLCFWPSPLVFDYGDMLVKDVGKILAGGLVICAFWTGIILAFKRGAAWAGFLGALFFTVLAPSSSVVPVATQTIAEHRMYLPLAAIVALTVFSLYIIKQKITAKYGELAAIIALIAAAILGALTFQRNKTYQTEIGLWNDVIEKRPANARAYDNRGNIYAKAGQHEKALEDFDRAIKLKPEYPEALNNRANTRQELGRLDNALADYNRAIAITPDYAEAYYNRGNIYRMLEKYGEALKNYTRTIELKPDHVKAINNRAGVLRLLGQYGKAALDYQQAIMLQPDNPSYCKNYAWMLATAMDKSARNGALAVKLATRACMMTGGNYQPLDALAAACAEAGRFNEAVKAAREAAQKAKASGDDETAAAIEERLRLFQSQLPYRDPVIESQ